MTNEIKEKIKKEIEEKEKLLPQIKETIEIKVKQKEFDLIKEFSELYFNVKKEIEILKDKLEAIELYSAEVRKKIEEWKNMFGNGLCFCDEECFDKAYQKLLNSLGDEK